MAKKGRGILLVYTDLADEKYDEEFNAWYDTEHVPERLGAPGFLGARRWVAKQAETKYLALYDLDSLDALKPGPDLDAAINTPWADRIRPHFQAITRGTYLAYPAGLSTSGQRSQAETAS